MSNRRRVLYTSFVASTALRVVVALLCWRWLHSSTPLHRLVPWHGRRIYANLEFLFQTGVIWYALVTAVSAVWVWLLRRTRGGDKAAASVLQTVSLLLFFSDLLVVFGLQVATSGPESVLRYGSYVLIAFFCLTFGKWYLTAVYIVLNAVCYVLQFALYELRGTSDDLLIELLMMAAFGMAVSLLRNKISAPETNE